MLHTASRCWRTAVVWTLLVLFLLTGVGLGADYEREIKPLLEEKCYACHGALKQAGGLRVDTANSLLIGGDSGAAVDLAAPHESLLIGALTGAAGFQMPPAAEGAPLSSQQIDLVLEWLKQGARHPVDETPQQDPRTWWSYQPVQRPAIPRNQLKWCRNPVDHFIAAKREELGLPVAGEADKSVWLRRVYLDLIGVPPTRQEQLDFAINCTPTAYERVVDDLLSRPEYGERWGRHWMDIWRYSDWYGSRGINEIRYSQRHIWRWRDWIVQSLNDDKGYDRMVAEMLAGDEIGNGDPTVMAATGFLGRNWYKFDREAWMFETVERTSEAFLGLTMRCCRCHDHKFDPITQSEYYRFRAIFEPHDVRTDSLSAFTQREKDATLGQVLSDGVATVFDKSLEAVTYRFERGDSRFPDQSQAMQPGVPSALGGDFLLQPIELPVEAWYPTLRPGMLESLRAQSQLAIQDAEDRVNAASVALDRATKKRDAHNSQNASSQRLAALLDDDFQEARPNVWEVVSGDWDYVEDRLVQSTVTSFATMVTKQEIQGDFKVSLRYRPLAPGSYRSVGFSFDYLDAGNSQDVYTSTGDQQQSVQAFHRIDGQQTYPADGIVATSLSIGQTILLEATVKGSQLGIDLDGKRMLDYRLPVQRRKGRFAIWVHQGAAEFLQLEITPLATTGEMLQAERDNAMHTLAEAKAAVKLANAEFDALSRRIDADLARFLKPLSASSEDLAHQALAAERQAAVSLAELGMLQAEGDSEAKRSEASQRLDEAVKAAANPAGQYTPVGTQYPRTSTGRRAALARWLTEPDNPRTARIAVNHLWCRHFGVPLVETAENFGLNGRTPSHPELLDWLASELMASDWQMKPLHKLLVLSATYRMASTLGNAHDRKEERELASRQDTNNRFYWRMNSRRMEAEVVRDATLYLAQKLNQKMGGVEIDESKGEEIPRRSLYFRNTPNETMLLLDVFDVADPNACYRRRESIVPHQSLAMMNSGLVQDAARDIARQLAGEEQFIEVAFETILARPPHQDERIRCEEFLASQTERLSRAPSERYSMGGTAQSKPADQPQQRARENLIHALLMHHDFVTIR